MNDKEVILSAMQRERDELHSRIMQVDRIINRLKGMEDVSDNVLVPTAIFKAQPIARKQPLALGTSKNIKLVVLNVFDVLGRASKLKDIQMEYENISGNKYNIREAVRSLYRSNLLRMIKEKGTNKTTFWAKKDWIENNQLLDEYKPEGFDLLYTPDNLIYE